MVGAPSFIESSFTSKTEYETWLSSTTSDANIADSPRASESFVGSVTPAVAGVESADMESLIDDLLFGGRAGDMEEIRDGTH